MNRFAGLLLLLLSCSCWLGLNAQELPVLSNTLSTRIAETSPGIWVQSISTDYSRICPGSDDCGDEICLSYFGSSNTMAVIFPYVLIYPQYANYTPSAFWADRSFTIQGIQTNDPYFSSFSPIDGIAASCIGFDDPSNGCYEFIVNNYGANECIGFLLSEGNPLIISC